MGTLMKEFEYLISAVDTQYFNTKEDVRWWKDKVAQFKEHLEKLESDQRWLYLEKYGE